MKKFIILYYDILLDILKEIKCCESSLQDVMSGIKANSQLNIIRVLPTTYHWVEE